MGQSIKDKIAVTTGDPNGIGAEVTIKALNSLNLPEDEIVLFSNKKIFDFYSKNSAKLNKNYEIIEIPYYEKDIKPGEITKEAGEFSFQTLKKVCELKPKAIVTSPVAKNALHLAGHNFNGQTEVLQKYLSHNNQKAEMLFVADNFRVLLLTRHCALKEINLTKDMIINKIENLSKTFKNVFKIDSPKFALCSLNPHAGEGGILGREEIESLNPAVEVLQSRGINITPPKPSDTLFINAAKHYYADEKDDFDCYIACYHDQGLIPIKTVAGYHAVNTTIGLDILRTSPDHGTAFDIAGKNLANPEGMIEAIKLAFKYA